MSIQQALIGIGGRRARGRLGRVLPWIGVAFALVSVGAAIRRKGFVRGSVDSALNAMPVVGSLKAAAELVRGRDFIAPKSQHA